MQVLYNAETFPSVSKSEMISNVKQYQTLFWNRILKTRLLRVKTRGFTFYNQIQTDGVSVTLLFIKARFANKKFGQRLPKQDTIERRKLERLTKEDCVALEGKNLVGVDPGKCSLGVMIDSTGKTFRYRNCRRKFECYVKQSRKKLESQKRFFCIKEDFKHSSRALDIDEYVAYLKEKMERKTTLETFYRKPLFRRLALTRHIRTQKSEAQLLKDVETRFGRDCVIGIGDWSRTSRQLKGSESSLTCRFYNLLASRFTVFEVNEDYTSQRYHADTSRKLENLKGFNLKTQRSSKIYSLLTAPGTPRVVINRDNYRGRRSRPNASRNILTLVRSWVTSQTRPSDFCCDARCKSKSTRSEELENSTD